MMNMEKAIAKIKGDVDALCLLIMFTAWCVAKPKEAEIMFGDQN